MPTELIAAFVNKLSLFLSPDEIITSYTKRYAFGTDARFYCLVPKLILPALNENALKPLRAQVKGKCTEGFSNSRTCEVGLTKAADIPYQSIVYLLDRVSK